MKFETKSIHAGQTPDEATGAVMVPIYQTSTYAQDKVGQNRGFEYSRTANPTRTALETCIAALEGAEHGLAFASGMAATDAVLRLLSPGDHVVCGNDVYGGTYRLFEHEFGRYGVHFSYVDAGDLKQIQQALTPQTRLVWLETPTNPLLTVVDIAAVAEILGRHPGKPWLAVDNTFATPYLQRPIELGADFVMHSTTKYLGGHSDVIGGAIVAQDAGVAQKLAFLQNAVGAVPGPMDCFLVLRGLKTLPVRMDRHSENAAVVAEYLIDHPRVSTVLYPFEDSHPQAELARRQMKHGGGMISFTLKGDPADAKAFVERTRIFTLAESLGGVESLVELPAVMTHMSTSDSPLAIDPRLIRLSVGLEHVDDLLEDLERALAGSA